MSQRPKLLVIDDGDRYIELAHALLREYDYATRCELPGPCWACSEQRGCKLTHAHNAAEADDALRRHPDTDVVLLDVAFDIAETDLLPSSQSAQDPSESLERRRRLQGLAILDRLRRSRTELPVILMTSLDDLALEDGGFAPGADELLTLAGADAFDARALGLLIERILARRHEVAEAGGFAWGTARAMTRLRQDATTLARTSLPILLLGATGTGKSALAEHVIHPATGRRGPFLPVDLSALPETLVAAELFGTARGAFSGAIERTGLFAQADGGTLLLDEIGNLPLDLQRMLLLVLQSGRVTRLGEAESRTVDVKVVAATNADLEAEVRAGRFRADLYARLNPAARLVLPPLTSRIGDLKTLIDGFVGRAFAVGPDRALLGAYAGAAGLRGSPAVRLTVGEPAKDSDEYVTFVLSPQSFRTLEAHAWPGNVRELELFVKNAVVFALADALGAAERGRGGSGGSAAAARTIPISSRLVGELVARSWAAAPAVLSAAGGELADEPRGDFVPTFVPGPGLRDAARHVERQLYEHLFRKTGGDFAAMAGLLLTGDPAANARKVRLRFNQLGLKVRDLR
ncbi:MAG: sigma-54-dependent Fis family transcriptional regulator [Deltaproteobacteria bacterium]|nr:sigma-54-dependent Fis family transcriptional regulator [Deltaproteobacteria bacterium]